MTDKRYQVFISSTFTDLKDERQAVAAALMDIGHIPAGMEHFPALDEEQFEFIKRVIDVSDYYLVIVGARYGSMTTEGVSYTEKEYEYAKNKGMKVIGLLHGKPEDLPMNKSEGDPEVRVKLQAFRSKLQDKKLTKYWESTGELTTAALAGLLHAINYYPAIGWVRADQVANVQVLNEINELRKRNAELEIATKRTSAPAAIADMAGLDEEYEIRGVHKSEYGFEKEPWSKRLTWREIFRLVAPCLLSHPNDELARSRLAKAFDEDDSSGSEISIQEHSTVMLQLKNLGFVNSRFAKSSSGGMGLFWALTELGEAKMTEFTVVRSKKAGTATGGAKGSPAKRKKLPRRA